MNRIEIIAKIEALEKVREMYVAQMDKELHDLKNRLKQLEDRWFTISTTKKLKF